MNTRGPRCTRRSLWTRRAAGGELNGLALKRQTAQPSSALKVVGDELGLDPSASRHRARRERLLQLVRGQGPRPGGGQTTPNATILVAIRLARCHGHAVGAHIRRGDSGDSFRPAMPPPEKRQKPKKAPNPGGNPGNPRKWAKTENRQAQKRATAAIRADKTPRKTGAIGLGTSPLEPEPGLWQTIPAKMQRRRTARKGPEALGTGRAARRGARPPAQKGEAHRAMSSRPLGQNPWRVTLCCSRPSME